MNNIVSPKLRRASLLVSGDHASNVLDLGLSIVTASVCKSELPNVLILSDAPTEGRDLCDRLGGMIDNYSLKYENSERLAKLKRKCLNYRYNVLVGQPNKLARAIMETLPISHPTWLIRADDCQTQTASIKQWFAYANEIIDGLAVVVMHIVKTDTMKQLPCDPAQYTHHWEARDYFPRSHNERFGNAVVLTDHSTGKETVWRSRAQSGSADLWYPALDETVEA